MKFFFSTVTAKYTSENCQLSVQCCALDCLFLILFNENDSWIKSWQNVYVLESFNKILLSIWSTCQRLVHAHLIHRPTASVITERVIFIVCVSHNVYHVWKSDENAMINYCYIWEPG